MTVECLRARAGARRSGRSPRRRRLLVVLSGPRGTRAEPDHLPRPSTGRGLRPGVRPERVARIFPAVVVTRAPLPQVHNIGMRGYVGVTDEEWYRFLAARPEISEAKSTSGGRAAAARFARWRRASRSSSRPTRRITASSAAASSAGSPRCACRRPGMSRPGQRRGQPGADARADRALPAGADRAWRRSGDRLRFRPERHVLPRRLWRIDPPPGFAPNIVQGKGYDMGDPAVFRVFRRPDAARPRRGGRDRPQPAVAWPGPVFGDPRLAPYRLGSRHSRPSC